jgi:hypothetical protein
MQVRNFQCGPVAEKRSSFACGGVHALGPTAVLPSEGSFVRVCPAGSAARNRRRLGLFSRHELHVDMKREVDHARFSKDIDINILLPDGSNNKTVVSQCHQRKGGCTAMLRTDISFSLLVPFQFRNVTSPPHLPARYAGAMR